jgi:hypothetical protein
LVILLKAIVGYSIGGYWWLFYLLAIGGYFIYWLLVVILLMVINGYSISGYWCLLMVINGYYIGGYFVIAY